MAADDDTGDVGPDGAQEAGPRDATTLYSVTVTTPGSGRVHTVEVPARSAGGAFPIACAWFPQLPLTGAHVEVVALGPEPHAGPRADPRAA